MVKRASSVVPWNAPKRRKTMMKPKIALSQLPASVKPEVKFSDRRALQSTAVASAGSIFLRPDDITTTQGDDGDQMTGSDVFLRAVDYSLQLPTSGWNICRVSILIPRDPSITAAPLLPVFRYSHREFVVLHDEVFSSNEKNHCRIKKTLNLKQKWNLTGTTITENNVLVIANFDQNVAFDSSARTYFTDP